MSVRVLIADDQALVRGGFRMIVEANGLEVVGEAADGAEAVALVAARAPDVVLMDVRMPGVDGIEATRRIASSGSGARIVILTTYHADEYVLSALRAGASGFLLKDVRPAELVDAIHVVARGDALLAPTVTRRLIDRIVSTGVPTARERPADLDTLTEREGEVLRFMALALSNAEIARRLHLTGRPSRRTSRRSCASSDCAIACRPSCWHTTSASYGRAHPEVGAGPSSRPWRGEPRRPTMRACPSSVRRSGRGRGRRRGSTAGARRLDTPERVLLSCIRYLELVSDSGERGGRVDD